MVQNYPNESDFVNTLKEYQIQSKLADQNQSPLNSPLRNLWANLQTQEKALSTIPISANNPELTNSLKQFQEMKSSFAPKAPQAYQANKSDMNAKQYTDPNRSLFLNSINELYAPNAVFDKPKAEKLSQNLENSYTGLSQQPTNLQDTELVNALKQLYGSSSPTTTYSTKPTQEQSTDAQHEENNDDESSNWLRQYGQTHGIDPHQIEDFLAGKRESIETPDNDPNFDIENEVMDPTGTYQVVPLEEETVDNTEEEAIQDPQTRADLDEIYSSPEFVDQNHEQQTINKFANNPLLQSYLMSQNPQTVMNTALGKSLETIAQSHLIEPGNPMSERYRQRFDQGTGIYKDPFTNEAVTRPNFFQRLNGALKYLFGNNDNQSQMQQNQMQIRNDQSRPQRLPYIEQNVFQYPARSDQFTPSDMMQNPLPYMNMGNINANSEPEPYSIPPSTYLSGGSYGNSDGMMAGLYSPPLLSRPLYTR